MNRSISAPSAAVPPLAESVPSAPSAAVPSPAESVPSAPSAAVPSLAESVPSAPAAAVPSLAESVTSAPSAAMPTGAEPADLIPDQPPRWFQNIVSTVSLGPRLVHRRDDAAYALGVDKNTVTDLAKKYPFFKPSVRGVYHPEKVRLMGQVLSGILEPDEAQRAWDRFRITERRRDLGMGADAVPGIAPTPAPARRRRTRSPA